MKMYDGDMNHIRCSFEVLLVIVLVFVYFQ